MSELHQKAIEVISKGSKSFSLASKFFPEDLQVGASLIYMWCRHCDDEIDEAIDPKVPLEKLVSKTTNIYEQTTTEDELPFLALKEVAQKYGIPAVYPLDLLAGMKMDTDGVQYQSFEELRLYCYRVASTVGIMMCYVMGLFRIGALKEAAHLGMAMQLSNIARDIKEDFELGRSYLPSEWLNQVDLNSDNYLENSNRHKLFLVVKRVIAESERLYESGLSGINSLPWRSALTILIAGKIYREIGREILRRGTFALETRTVVPLWRKVLLIISSLFELLLTIPGRLVRDQGRIEINELWRLT